MLECHRIRPYALLTVIETNLTGGKMKKKKLRKEIKSLKKKLKKEVFDLQNQIALIEL